MLSAAHVLAMDAKNLLDVVDSVRVRYPDLFINEHSSPSRFKTSEETSESYSAKDQERDDGSLSSVNCLMASINVDNDDNGQQTYQNLSKLDEIPPPPPPLAIQEEIYANQEQIESANKSEGVYDNDWVVGSRFKNRNFELKNVNSFASTAIIQSNKSGIYASSKPPVAAKPGNYQHYKSFFALY